MFYSKTKKIIYTTVNLNFTIKVGCKGSTLHGHVSMIKESHVLSENCQILQPYQSLHILHRGVNVMSEDE